MTQIPEFLSKEDELNIGLPGLFESHGYHKYKMAKFEEYSFYSDNRKFLTDDGVIAFNNADGRLMALKPDITLSVIKNAKLSEKLTRLYYNESVFRMSSATKDFREIKQCGIEVLGETDNYITSEVIYLAAKSLEMIDEKYYLSLSHNGLVLSMIDDFDVSISTRKKLARCIGSKNAHDFRKICNECSINSEKAEDVISMFSIESPIKQAITQLESLCKTPQTISALEELRSLCSALSACGIEDKVHVDLSVTQHIDYYNGIVFRGYVEKAPVAVLSGGRYDLLAEKIRDNIGAIGFAVYLDNINLYYNKKREFDTDILIINKGSENVPALLKTVSEFTKEGKTVCVELEKPENYRCKQTFVFENNELREAE